VFLFLTIPQLLTWARPGPCPLPLAPAALAVMLATLWVSIPVPTFPSWANEPWQHAMYFFSWDELLNWLLFVYLIAGLAVALVSSRERVRTLGLTSQKTLACGVG
jgi:hypothetical protein